MNKRIRIVFYLCFVFLLILSGTAFSQEFYRDKTPPPLEKILQVCDQLGKYYIGQYKDCSGVVHIFFHRADMAAVQIVLYHLDTDLWVASGYCACPGCSRVITK